MAQPKKVVPIESWSPGQPWEPVPTPSRFKNALSKYRVWRDEAKCIKCGRCVEVCPYGVHTKSGSYLRRPKSYRCLGTTCQNNDFYCVKNCPVQALSVSIHPVLQHPGRQPLDPGPAPLQLVAGGDGHPVLYRPGLPPGRLPAAASTRCASCSPRPGPTSS